MKLGVLTSAKRWSLLAVMALLIASCSEPADIPVAEEAPPTTPQVAVLPDAAELTAGLVRLDGKATAEITVGSEVITVELDGNQAPITAGNFVDLAQKGVYDNTIFHRVVTTPEPFVAQGGDPQSKDPNVPNSRLGTGGYIDEATGAERTIPLEILTEDSDEIVYGTTLPDAQIQSAPVLKHDKGAIAMARSGTNTASSQFYITLADVPFLDGSYAVFGYVTDGMDVVNDIQLGDVITSVKITSGMDNLVVPE
mgnify:CR=1 FL=1